MFELLKVQIIEAFPLEFVSKFQWGRGNFVRTGERSSYTDSNYAELTVVISLKWNRHSWQSHLSFTKVAFVNGHLHYLKQ